MADFFTGSIEAAKCGEIVEGKNGEKYLKLGDAFKLHEKSGRYFLNFNYEELTEASKEKSFGNTHYICVSQTKEEREQKENRLKICKFANCETINSKTRIKICSNELSY